jgi:glycosyltransferase involved in cell wall biosynthesis
MEPEVSDRPTHGPSRRPAVILCGPFPDPRIMGGYARCNELIATSFLDERFGIHRLAITLPGQGGPLRRMREDARRTLRCLREVDAPIFHLTSQYVLGTYREYAQYLLARRFGRAFLLDIRAGSFVESFERPGALLERPLLRSMIRGAAAITVEGKRYVDWIAREFDREAVWFPNFVPKQQATTTKRAPLEPPPPGEPIRVAYSGRIVPGKGLEELIEAAGILRDEGIDLEIHVLGPDNSGHGGLLRDLARKRLRPERLVFHGLLDHRSVLANLASCHLFAFPSRWPGEGHSNAVNEAMQVGLPVVTSRQGFLGDVVTAECGEVLDDPTPAAIGRAIAGLAADWSRLRRCGEAAHRRVVSEFSDETALGRLAGVYERLLAAAR